MRGDDANEQGPSPPGEVWSAPTARDRDRKELRRTLLDDVTLKVEREKSNAHLTLRWRGGLMSELDVPLPRSHPAPIALG